MSAKEKLKEILKENSELKEEISKMKENEADKDTQTEPAQPAPAVAGAKKLGDETSKDVVQENEAGKDTQVEPTPAVAPTGDGAKKLPDEATKDVVTEQVDEKDEDKDKEKKEQVDEQRPDEEDEVKEQLGDMDKVVEILEVLKAKVDELSAQLVAMKGETPAPMDEEPQEPMQEKVNLGVMLKESVSSKDEEFTEVVNEVLR